MDLIYGLSLVIICLALVIASCVTHNRIERKLLQKQALKRGGRLNTRLGFVYPHSLSFPYKNAKVIVKYVLGEFGAFPVVRIESQINKQCIVTIVQNYGRFTKIAMLGNLSNIKLGIPRFESKFMVYSNDENFTNELITPELQEILLRLEVSRIAIGLIFKRDSFSINVNKYLSNDTALDGLIDIALAFYDRLKQIAITH